MGGGGFPIRTKTAVGREKRIWMEKIKTKYEFSS